MTKKGIDAIQSNARMAVAFNARSENGNKYKVGGNKLTHKASKYGIAIKWLVHIKGYTYLQFAKAYNGTTAQNLNHIINRISPDRFFEDDMQRMCEILKISYDYFTGLCDEIGKIVEKTDGIVG